VKEGYQLWALWKTKCWKCGKDISVAINTAGFSFNPFQEWGGEDTTWTTKTDKRIEEVLRKLGVKRELRYSKTVESCYIANVCPYCGVIQGDWYLNEELIDFCSSENFPSTFKLLLFKNGKLIKEYLTISQFARDYKE